MQINLNPLNPVTTFTLRKNDNANQKEVVIAPAGKVYLLGYFTFYRNKSQERTMKPIK